MSVFHNPRMVTDPLLDENMPRTSKDKNKTSDVLLYMYCLGHTSHVGSEKIWFLKITGCRSRF